MDEKKLIPMGRFLRPHGVRGWIKIDSYASPSENLISYQPWFLKTHTDYEPVKFNYIRLHGRYLVAQPEHCLTRDQAQTYTNQEIFIAKAQLPPLKPNEFYWTDLEGLAVVDPAGQHLGHVSYLFATGANDVLVVEGEKRLLIPFLIPQVILKVDLVNRFISVNWDPNF